MTEEEPPFDRPVSGKRVGFRSTEAARYSALGFEFVAGAVLGFWIGKTIDEWLGIPPVAFAILLPMLATAAIFVALWRDLAKGSKRESKASRRQRSIPEDKAEKRDDRDP